LLNLFKKKPDLNPERNMNILDHLEELRYRIILAVVALMIGFVGGIFIAKPVLKILFRPFAGIDLHVGEPILKIRVDEDGTLRVLNAKTREDFKKLSSYRIEFFLSETLTRMEQSSQETTGSLLQAGNSVSQNGELTTDTEQTSTGQTASSGWTGWIRSKLNFMTELGNSSDKQEIRPDFVYGYSLEKPIFLNPIDPVSLWLKTSFFLGLLIALPILLYQVWAFIAPGLMTSEKKVIIPILAFASILFPMGASMAYFGFRMVLQFLLTFLSDSMEPNINVFDLLGLEIKIMLGFGAAFELPIVIMFLTMLGLVTPTKLRAWRSYAIVVNAIIAAVLTPTPDPGTMMLMMFPLVILYEISIWASIPIARKRALADREIYGEDDSDDIRTVEEEPAPQRSVPDSVSPDAEGSVSTNDEPVIGPYEGYADSPQSYYEPPVGEAGSSAAGPEVYYEEPLDRRQEDRKRWKRKQLRRMRYRPDEEE